MLAGIVTVLMLPAVSVGAAPGGNEQVAQATGAYAVVVARRTYDDEQWKQVVDALVKKYRAKVVVYDKDVREARKALSEQMPSYACFVTPPDRAGRKFVIAVHRMTRELDDDPYTDVIWGILTGYTPGDALRIAELSRPLVVRRALSGTSSMGLGPFESGVKFSEAQKGVIWVKDPKGKEKSRPCDNEAKALADVFNKGDVDCFVTSGHATQRDWQMGYSYRGGQLRCHKGQLFSLDTAKKRYDIRSPNPKVYLPVGNCLIGHIDRRDCMVTALIHTGGFCQMFGYTVVTWYGYGGWGVRDLFFGQGGRFTFAEAFYFNHQSMLHSLQRSFPASASVNFDRYDTARDRNLLGRLAARHGLLNEKGTGLRNRHEMGLLWDRDTVAFYGDPAWEARLRPQRLAWDQKLTVSGDVYTFAVTTNRAGGWPGRPIAALLPHRVKNIEILAGADLEPVITDNFILLPLRGKFEAGKTIKVVFRASPAKPGGKTTAKAAERDFEKAMSLLPKHYRWPAACTLAAAGKNRGQLIEAVLSAAKDEREATGFLLAYMPLHDSQSLSKAYVAQNVKYALLARRKSPWGPKIPKDIFLNYVLPYASLDERRDRWRKDFYDRFAAAAFERKGPGEAAVALNQSIYKALGVSYHATKRQKPNQSPYESVKIRWASCTGLSILLVDACRSAGIPARVVGTPMWTNKKGNHTWVEVWDGKWHFLGAAESKALNSAWFTGQAAAADPKKPQHRIYAASYRRTGTHFPMVWSPKGRDVPAVNVTGYYTKKRAR